MTKQKNEDEMSEQQQRTCLFTSDEQVCGKPATVTMNGIAYVCEYHAGLLIGHLAQLNMTEERTRKQEDA